MRAPDLKHRIVIYRLINNKTDYGYTNPTYELKCSCRARVNYLSGGRTTDNEEIFYTVEREFIVRSYIPIEYTDIIKYDGDEWQVISIDRIHSYNDIVIRTTRINK